MIAKADQDGYLKADDFKKCNWVQKAKGSSQKSNTLTEEQCKKFSQLNLDEISCSPLNELYRDFCLFILYTGQSACDAISLKYSDIRKLEVSAISYLNEGK